MTPIDSISVKKAFALAAKEDDQKTMTRLLSQTPEHLSPIDIGTLFSAFSEALHDGRAETAKFLAQKTRLSAMLPQDMAATAFAPRPPQSFIKD